MNIVSTHTNQRPTSAPQLSARHLHSPASLLGAVLLLLLNACGNDRAIEENTLGSCRDELTLGSSLELDEQSCVVARVAMPEGAAFGLSPASLWTYAIDATSSNELRVDAFVLDVMGNSLGEQREVLRLAAQAGADEMVFPSAFVAVAPGPALAVGYTRGDLSGLIVGSTTSTTELSVAAPGNYDAAWLDSDALLVNGLGLGDDESGQALYLWQQSGVRRLIEGLGDSSGIVAVGDDVVFAGGGFGSFPNIVNRVFAFPRDRVEAAVADGTTLSADTDGVLAYEGDLADAVAMGNDLVVLDSIFDVDLGAMAFQQLLRVPLSFDQQQLVAGAAVTLVARATDANADQAYPRALVATGSLLGLELATADESVHDLALIRAR